MRGGRSIGIDSAVGGTDLRRSRAVPGLRHREANRSLPCAARPLLLPLPPSLPPSLPFSRARARTHTQLDEYDGCSCGGSSDEDEGRLLRPRARMTHRMGAPDGRADECGARRDAGRVLSAAGGPQRTRPPPCSAHACVRVILRECAESVRSSAWNYARASQVRRRAQAPAAAATASRLQRSPPPTASRPTRCASAPRVHTRWSANRISRRTGFGLLDSRLSSVRRRDKSRAHPPQVTKWGRGGTDSDSD